MPAALIIPAAATVIAIHRFRMLTELPSLP